MTPFYRTLRAIVFWVLKPLMRIKVSGRENEPNKGDGPIIICCNHIAASDPIAIGIALRYVQPHFMAKSSLFKNKFVGWLLRKMGAFPVNRDGNDVAALKNTLRLLKDGKCVGIFPQGTRYPGIDPATTEVKSGVGMICGYSGATVIPVFIDTKDHTPKLLRRRTVVIGKPMTPEEIAYVPRKADEYERISKLIFDRICLTGEEYKNSKKK